MYKNYIKRLLDIAFSFVAIIVFSPILITVALLVKTKLGSPIIFAQNRPGKNCKTFKMYKFRSMKDSYDEKGALLPDEMRMTSFGAKLRACSLDELPELVNILKGDMSFVGPRPQLVKDMIFFTEEQMKRQSVYPGLTGLAQINGRNNISWEEKFNYDLKYIENITLCRDLQIIYKTFFKVIKKEDIVKCGMETAEDLGDYLLRSGKISKKKFDKKIQLIIKNSQ